MVESIDEDMNNHAAGYSDSFSRRWGHHHSCTRAGAKYLTSPYFGPLDTISIPPTMGLVGRYVSIQLCCSQGAERVELVTDITKPSAAFVLQQSWRWRKSQPPLLRGDPCREDALICRAEDRATAQSAARTVPGILKVRPIRHSSSTRWMAVTFISLANYFRAMKATPCRLCRALIVISITPHDCQLPLTHTLKPTHVLSI